MITEKQIAKLTFYRNTKQAILLNANLNHVCIRDHSAIAKTKWCLLYMSFRDISS